MALLDRLADLLLPPDVARTRSAVAAALLRHYLDGQFLPDPDTPEWVTLDPTANIVADQLLRMLGELYDVERWDAAEFERVFVREVLPAYHGSLETEERPEGLVLSSPDCPVEPSAALDARVCDLCQLVQTAAARHAGLQALWVGVRGRGADRCHVVLSPLRSSASPPQVRGYTA